MTKIKRCVLYGILGAGLVAGLLGLWYLHNVYTYQNLVKNLTITEVNLSEIADGIYTGDCNVNFIYAKVQVTVNAGQITDITILQHKNDRGAAAEAITQQMVAEQKITVDEISGATNSSRVIQKAVENALQSRADWTGI